MPLAWLKGQAAALLLAACSPARAPEPAPTVLYAGCEAVAAGPTCSMLISHRFANVRTADRIVVLTSAGVVESGSHAELMAGDGLYAAMFRKQARGYA